MNAARPSTFRQAVFEVYGDVRAMKQALEDHLEWSKKIHQQREKEIGDHETRIKATETFLDRAKFFWKVVVRVSAGLAALGGLGVGLWQVLKS